MKKITAFLFLNLCFLFAHAQTWETLASLPASAQERHHPTTFSIDGIGYLVCGADDNAVSMNDFYSYDPQTNTWTTKTNFPGPSRGFAYAVESETKGYMGFGYQYEPGNSIEQYLADLWEYDPLTDTWTELAPFPGSARIHPAMVYLNGKIYVGCGGDALGDLGDWWEYDIDTDTWTAKATFPGSDRHHPYYFAIGDYAYVGMGHSGPNIFKDLYRYDPNTDSWQQMADIPDQARVAGTQFSFGGKGYMLSGQGNTHQNLPTGEFWEYDPLTNSWLQLTPHPGEGRWAPGSFVINGAVYFMCGESNSGLEKDMMRYQIEGFASNEVIMEEDQEISLFPNPANSQFQISNITTPAIVSVFDMNGKLSWEGIVQPQQQINVSGLQNGIYNCQILVNGDIRREKLIIQ
jgi:N-acetylneuraminic acid mutarotase